MGLNLISFLYIFSHNLIDIWNRTKKHNRMAGNLWSLKNMIMEETLQKSICAPRKIVISVILTSTEITKNACKCNVMTWCNPLSSIWMESPLSSLLSLSLPKPRPIKVWPHMHRVGEISLPQNVSLISPHSEICSKW